MEASPKLRDASAEPADEAESTPRHESPAERHERLRAASLYSPAWCGADIQRSAGFVYGEIREGRLRTVKMCGAMRIHREEWQRWLEENVTE